MRSCLRSARNTRRASRAIWSMRSRSKLLQRVPGALSEHVQYRWMSAAEAIATASSSTDRAVIRQLRH